MVRYRNINRAGWEYLARHGCESSRPCDASDLPFAKQWVDPESWIPWSQVRSVLCLASGGGQQAVMFASLGCKVTVLDISPEQLRRDRVTATKLNLALECIEGDMCDLSLLYGRDYDLVYQAISACYVPDVSKVYEQVFQVMRPGGFYRVEHWTPLHLQLPQYSAWDGGAYRIVHPQTRNQPVQWREWNENGQESPTCWHFVHSLDRLIGGLCEAGFVIKKFKERRVHNLTAEPGSSEHLAAFVPPFFTLFSSRIRIPQAGNHHYD